MSKSGFKKMKTRLYHLWIYPVIVKQHRLYTESHPETTHKHDFYILSASSNLSHKRQQPQIHPNPAF